jgi:hypothetical protein
MPPTNIDEFASQVFEEAKRFLERYDDSPNSPAYLHAAISLAFSSFEAHVNAIAEEFLTRPELNIWERGFLSEKRVDFDDGEFTVSESLKMEKLQDRLLFICRRFSTRPIDRTSPMWSNLKSALKLRNQLTHPKELVEITKPQVSAALEAILEILDYTYRSLYKQAYPTKHLGLQSMLDF